MTEAGYHKDPKRSDTVAESAANSGVRIHRKGSYKLLNIMILLTGALLLWGMISWGFSAIPLKNIHVEGLTRYAEEEILITSGLSSANKLFGVDKEYVKQTLTEFYPYIRSVRLSYAFPMGYNMEITEEVPVYYTRIADDYFALSAELKVLEKATVSRRFEECGLQQITLGGIQSAMLGETLKYGGDYLNRVLKDIGDSVIADQITDVVLRDRYHLSVICDGVYTLYLGDIEAIDAKLRLASAMMQEADLPAGYRAILDVSDLKKTSIRFDGMLDAALFSED